MKMWETIGKLSVRAILAIALIAAVIVGTLGLFGVAAIIEPAALVTLAGMGATYFFMDSVAKRGGGAQ